jgi:hypothetical protein
MTDASEAEKSRILNGFRDLKSSVTEQSLLSDVSSTATQIQDLPKKLQDIRQRGYAYAADLEQKIADLTQRWREAEEEARYRGQRRSHRISWDLEDMQHILDRLAGADSATMQAYLSRLSDELNRVKNEIDTAKKQIAEPTGDIPTQVRELADRVSTIDDYMKRVIEASFPFQPDEKVYMAVEAEWKKTSNDKENPDGVFYVTNKRLIMEQKEKKGGFVGIGGQKVQGLAWEAPISSVQSVSSEKKGMFGNIDLIHIHFNAGSGPAPETIIEVKGGI